MPPTNANASIDALRCVRYAKRSLPCTQPKATSKNLQIACPCELTRIPHRIRREVPVRARSITQALAAFGRAGVPLYVVYNSKPGSSDPVILPQLLTPSIVQGVFADTPGRDPAP